MNKKVNLQEKIKPSISNKTKNVLGVDRVEYFIQCRNAEVPLSRGVVNKSFEPNIFKLKIDRLGLAHIHLTT